jgi:hypothetical protein
MSNILVAFLLGVGVATWVYSKLMRSTGGNTQNALIASGAVGGVAFIIMLIVMSIIT